MIDRQNWDDQNQDFGRDIFNLIPISERADWIGSIILFLYTTVENIELLNDLWKISLDESKYLLARKIFDQLRSEALSDKNQSLVTCNIIFIGEIAAKIIANAGGDNFNKHAGWRIAPQLKRIMNQIKNKEIEDKCWNLLIREDYNKNSHFSV